MAKGILHLRGKDTWERGHPGREGYGSDHLLKARKDYTCKWCKKSIRKGDLYARHSPNKFKEPMYPVCRDCAWWLR